MTLKWKSSRSWRKVHASFWEDVPPEILKDQRNAFNIYVCADKEDRIKRIMGKENLSHEEAEQKIEKTDQERAEYYYEHTGKTWGDVNNYHMILNTSDLGWRTVRIF